MRLLHQETVTVQIHSLWSHKCKVSQEQTGHICPPDTFNRPLRYNSLQRKWRRLYAETHGQLGQHLRGGVGWVPCASVRNEPHCMWRLETVTLLMFSQHSQGWNSALLEGWSYNSSLFYALYCIYSNTSLSSLSVLQQRWILWSHLSVSLRILCSFGHWSWKSLWWNKSTFSTSCWREGALLSSQPQLVAVRRSKVILL